MTKDELITAKIEDKIMQSRDGYYVTATGFLDSHEQALAKKPAMSSALSHRDYLGSILGLGIERRLTGDILVRDDGADIFIVPEIAEFLLSEYHQAGRTGVKTGVVSAGEVIVPETRCEMIRDTVSSVRLDSVTSSAFRISRNIAADVIRSGLVSVDHAECLKADAKVEEGAVIVLKGKGKAILEEIGKESKKNRIWIRIKRFL